MSPLNPQFVIDKDGKKVSVILPIREFEALLTTIEELQDVQSYDRVKIANEPLVPYEKAFKSIEDRRRKKKK